MPVGSPSTNPILGFTAINSAYSLPAVMSRSLSLYCAWSIAQATAAPVHRHSGQAKCEESRRFGANPYLAGNILWIPAFLALGPRLGCFSLLQASRLRLVNDGLPGRARLKAC